MDMDVTTGISALGSEKSIEGAAKIAAIRHLIGAKNDELLSHKYFRMSRANQIGRAQMIEITKQLYCFSVCFERLMTRRIANYSSSMDPRVIQIARRHLREEIGHAQMFYDCLAANGVTQEELARIVPKTFTKAMFGYLTATVQHENEYVTNIAIMQVMETIGYHFFSATLAIMKNHGMMAQAMQQHADDDEDHANLGVELIADFDDKTMADSRRVICDIYHLMGFMLDDWLLGEGAAAAAGSRRRRSARPPKSN
jgi:ferritin-like protein